MTDKQKQEKEELLKRMREALGAKSNDELAEMLTRKDSKRELNGKFFENVTR